MSNYLDDSRLPAWMPCGILQQRLRRELESLFKSTPCMPIMVRLAWHDAGTYCAKTKTGGANGSIRLDLEAALAVNNGLKIAHDLLAAIKASNPDGSYADLYQLAAVVAIELTGGPEIPFRFGRVNATEADCTADGRLPDGNTRMPHLREVFHRMGFSDAEMVTLSGAHTLGRAHKDRSGLEKYAADQEAFFKDYVAAHV